MAEITDIRRAGRGSHRRRLYLDGAEWGSVPDEVLRALGLRVGASIDEGTLAEGIAEAEPAQAWQRALRLLGHRDRGSNELRARLSEDGYSPGAVEDAVRSAHDLGYLDDRRFAEGLARRGAAKRLGRRRIESDLAAKGVDETLAAEVLAECCGEQAERERALSLAMKAVFRTPAEAPRIAARLCRAGFDTSLAWRVASEVAADVNEPSDEG